MRRARGIERLYMDFDGFFAGVEEVARPVLRGRAIAVTPFAGTDRTIVIAANAKAKACGVTTGTSVAEARALCPEIALVPQSPDLYVRAHHALINEIERYVPIDAICSVDELTAKLDERQRRDPRALARRIKKGMREAVGPALTASIGFGPNRFIAKIACKLDKPDGVTLIAPEGLPERLLDLDFDAIPGIGKRMARRLARAGVYDVAALWRTQPKQLRALWGNVNGERFWYALHGYDIEAEWTGRRMFGHSRVLPPRWRSLENAYWCSRLLAVKAARRMRRAGYAANRVWLWLSGREAGWSGEETLRHVRDDQACLAGLKRLWVRAYRHLPARTRIVRCGVAFGDLKPAGERQLDLLEDDDAQRRRWERTSEAIDRLNARYGETVVSIGPWVRPPGGYAGGKIAYARIPDQEDFW